jgi:hypothetical protein
MFTELEIQSEEFDRIDWKNNKLIMVNIISTFLFEKVYLKNK